MVGIQVNALAEARFYRIRRLRQQEKAQQMVLRNCFCGIPRWFFQLVFFLMVRNGL